MKMARGGAAKSTGCGVVICVMQEQFGLGVDDAKHGFTVDELALVMAAFDTHPEAGK